MYFAVEKKKKKLKKKKKNVSFFFILHFSFFHVFVFFLNKTNWFFLFIRSSYWFVRFHFFGTVTIPSYQGFILIVKKLGLRS